MRRAVLAAAAVVLLPFAFAVVPAQSQHAGGGPAPQGARVSIGFGSVAPAHLDVLTGDSVTWVNDSVRPHTATADDGSFDSGRMIPTARFSHAFMAAGDVPYHCVLHPFIRGVVSAHNVLLDAPGQPAASNRPFPLTGRAAMAPGTAISIQADRGAGFTPVATATLKTDATFVAPVIAGTTSTYRAVAGDDASAPVTLLVLDRRVALRARSGRRRSLVRASVLPASAGGHVVLQLYLREHFGWWPVHRARLNKASVANFSLRLGRRVAARVVLTLPDGATPLAISRTVRLGPTR
jgi:plastocyanin